MPTPAERRALLFLTAVGLLGAGVRVARAVGERPAVPAAAERAVAAQQAAIDRAAQRRDSTRRERERRRSRGWGEARRAEQDAKAERDAKAGPARARRAPATGGLPDRPLDVDVATAAELERLPRVGPALAARIVADRDSLGAFGSLRGLERVRGVGPAMLEALAPHVTFSGTPRPRDDPPQLSRPARNRRPTGRPSARTHRVPPVAAAPPRALLSRSRAPPSWPSRQPPPPSASATC